MRNFWGAQAASLQLAAACRQHFSRSEPASKQKKSRQAAETNRLAACAPRTHCTAAMTLSSIAIGVGSAPTSIVARVGFGLPGPAKYSEIGRASCRERVES